MATEIFHYRIRPLSEDKKSLPLKSFWFLARNPDSSFFKTVALHFRSLFPNGYIVSKRERFVIDGVFKPDPGVSKPFSSWKFYPFIGV